jgi:hypothetical protein
MYELRTKDGWLVANIPNKSVGKIMDTTDGHWEEKTIVSDNGNKITKKVFVIDVGSRCDICNGAQNGGLTLFFQNGMYLKSL